MGKYEGRDLFFKTNQDGLRTRYSRQEFLKYKNRLVILGDSYVFGIGVREGRTFPELIEYLLRRQTHSQDIAVLNAGLTSYSPLLEDLLFSGVIQYYQPTQVLLFLDETDIGDDIGYSHELKTKGNESYFDTNWKKNYVYHGALYELSRPLIENFLEYLEFPPKIFTRNFGRKYNYYNFKINIDNVVETNRFFIYRHPLEKTKPYFVQTLENIQRIAEKASKIGARFTLVIYPRFHHWNTRECPNNWESESYSLNDPFQFEYFRFFDENQDKFGFAYLNLLPEFQQTKKFPLVFENDPHWNERGCRFVAGIIARYLLERGL